MLRYFFYNLIILFMLLFVEVFIVWYQFFINSLVKHIELKRGDLIIQINSEYFFCAFFLLQLYHENHVVNQVRVSQQTILCIKAINTEGKVQMPIQEFMLGAGMALYLRGVQGLPMSLADPGHCQEGDSVGKVPQKLLGIRNLRRKKCLKNTTVSTGSATVVS